MSTDALRIETALAEMLEPFTCIGLLMVSAQPHRDGAMLTVYVEDYCLLRRVVQTRGRQTSDVLQDIVDLDGERLCFQAEMLGAVTYSSSGALAATVSLRDLRSAVERTSV